MGRLNSRLRGLEKRASATRPPRFVVISPASGIEHPAGSIAENPNGSGCSLFVPLEFAEDPEAGLTDLQRARIGDRDKIIIITCTHEWRAGAGGERWQEPG